MPFTKAQLDSLVEGVYSGSVSTVNLPTDIYQTYMDDFQKQIDKVYTVGDITDEKTRAKVNGIKQNMSKFSGAKTFHQVKDLESLLFDETGRRRTLDEFKEITKQVNKNYTKNWMKAEKDSVLIQSQNAKKWKRFEEEKDILPVLEYVTVGDDRVRHSHMELDGLRMKVGDPRWNTIAPQNGYGCRCIVVQKEEGTPTTKDTEARKKTKAIFDDFDKDAEFAYNPAKKDYIFKESGKGKHPYFRAPRGFKQDFENNFGFPPVDQI